MSRLQQIGLTGLLVIATLAGGYQLGRYQRSSAPASVASSTAPWFSTNPLILGWEAPDLSILHTIVSSSTPYTATHAPITFDYPPFWHVSETTSGSAVDGATDTVTITSNSDVSYTVVISYYLDPDGSKFLFLSSATTSIAVAPAANMPAVANNSTVVTRTLVTVDNPHGAFVLSIAPKVLKSYQLSGTREIWYIPEHGSYIRIDTTLGRNTVADTAIYEILGSLQVHA